MKLIAPDICTLVEYDGRGWRVTGWLKEAVRPQFDENQLYGDNGVLAEILFDACQEIGGKRLVHCTREEATMVSLYAICGAIVPVEQVKVTGRVNWSEDMIEQQRRSALRAVGRMVF